MNMDKESMLRKLEGLHTIETAAEALGMGRQSALNLLSRLKRDGYVTASGGGKQKRLYKITMRKQLPRNPGMFDILNKYNPAFKLNPWFDHQVHGHYGPEEALLDAIETKSFRAILASLRLFNHITDWKGLYHGAKGKEEWQKIMALYEVSRRNLRAKKIPKRYAKEINPKGWVQLSQLKKRENFQDIADRWKVYIPFNEKDLQEVR